MSSQNGTRRNCSNGGNRDDERHGIAFAHQADDPSVPDLDEWTNEGTEGEPDWVLDCGRYGYSLSKMYLHEDWHFVWQCHAMGGTKTLGGGICRDPEVALAALRHFHAQAIAKAKELAAINETRNNEEADDGTMPDGELQRILGGPSEDAFYDRPRPVRYALTFYEGTFKNDSCGFESTTPFMPISVGDFITSRSDIPAVEGKLYRVTAVQHTINRYEDEICHHVEVCLVKH